jgi:hypothetical protein
MENHVCKTPACCTDADCDDQTEGTTDVCKFPSTKTAKCTHTILNACTLSSDCDDDDDTTKDSCSSRTPRTCIHDLITKCTDNDNFCPPDCTYTDDDDCSRVTTCDADDLDCFLEELTDCDEASLLLTVDNNTANIDMEITTKIVIAGETTHHECEVSFTTKNIDLAFTNHYKNELADDDYTDDEIDELESVAQDTASEVEGYDWKCTFDDTDDLANILNDWDDGDYSLQDFNDADCEGDYFD